MTIPRLLVALGIAFVLLLLGLAVGVWWYLFGTNELDSAELVPANTIFFVSIPNAANIVEGYETSHVKKLVEDPNSKPLRDVIANYVGTKNLDLLQAFLPNLSGQSFIAVTHFDYDHPEKVGLIAAMKPKPGLGNFNAFIEKLKTTWPEIKLGRTGTSSVEGIDYQWIQGPGALDRICVAQINGWIVTAWGEASLQDWIERFQKKSTTSSLAKDVNYQKTIVRVGDDPMALVYMNSHQVAEIARKEMSKANPTAADYMAQKLQAVVGLALGARFENGQIVDRFTALVPRPVQLECGMPEEPCAFDTLKFTGPDTRFYWATGINWKQLYNHLKDYSGPSAYNQTSANPMANDFLGLIKTWVHSADLDAKRNIVDALGSELSVQLEWPADVMYPEVGLFAKVDKPDDFKPTVDAIVESVRRAYSATGAIKELNSNGHTFKTLQFTQSSVLSPTIIEDSSYLGIFLTQDQAMRCFQGDPSAGVTHRDEFNAQIGDKRTGATQILFLDSPYLLNRTYKTAMPYISLVGMLDKNLASMLRRVSLPEDLNWLAPVDTWSCVLTADEEGIQVYSVSGIGNQGIVIAGGTGVATTTLQSLGYLPKYAGKPLGSSASVPSPALSTPPASAVIGAAPPSATGTPVTSIIFITADSKIVLDENTISENQIADVLKTKKAANPDLKLSVMVDRNASPDVLSTVMDAGASAGFGELPYVYAPKSLASPTNSDSTVAPSTDVNHLAPATNAIPDANSATPGPIHPH